MKLHTAIKKITKNIGSFIEIKIKEGQIDIYYDALTGEELGKLYDLFHGYPLFLSTEDRFIVISIFVN